MIEVSKKDVQDYYSDTLTQCTYCREPLLAYSSEAAWWEGFPYCRKCYESLRAAAKP